MSFCPPLEATILFQLHHATAISLAGPENPSTLAPWTLDPYISCDPSAWLSVQLDILPVTVCGQISGIR